MMAPNQFYFVNNSGEIVHSSDEGVINKPSKEVWDGFQAITEPGVKTVGTVANLLNDRSNYLGLFIPMIIGECPILTSILFLRFPQILHLPKSEN